MECRSNKDIGNLKILNIGCGSNVCHDHVNVDIREDSLADIICDIRHLPFENERFDEILSTDVLEHISHRETYQTFQEWLRVLKKGGKIKLQVPNILVAFESIAKGDYGTALNVLYGAQDYPQNCHYMGFTPSYLRNFLEEHNVEIKTMLVSGLHIVVEGIKK